MRLSGPPKVFQDEMQKHRSNVWVEFVNHGARIRVHFRDTELEPLWMDFRSDAVDSDPIGVAGYAIYTIKNWGEL